MHDLNFLNRYFLKWMPLHARARHIERRKKKHVHATRYANSRELLTCGTSVIDIHARVCMCKRNIGEGVHS